MTNSGSGDGELIAAVNGVVYPLSRDECVFRATGTGERHVMTLQVLRAMDLCSYFRTMDEHVAAVMNGISELKGRDADVRRVIDSLRSRGLFTTAASALEALDSRGREPAAFAGAMVRTGGRAQCLENLLRSIAAIRDDHGNDCRVHVFDDSSSPDAADACAAVCARWRDDGLNVHWLDREWQSRFVADLVERAEVEPDSVRWLLDPAYGHEGFTGGRLWNLILLAGAGKRFLFLDDDLVLSPRRMETEAGVEFDSARWEVWFHANAAQASESGTPLEIDPVAEHLTYLGEPVVGALGRPLGDPGDLRGLDQRNLQAIDGDASVAATVSGTYGDTTTGGGNHWKFLLTGDSRERLWADRDNYDRNRRTRWVTRVKRRLTVNRRTHFTHGGLDASLLLAPTTPFGRNEDRLFHTLVERVHPSARVFELPWAFGHFPEEEREASGDLFGNPMRGNLSTFVSDFLGSRPDPLPGVAPERQLRHVADQVGSLAELGDDALADRLDEFLMYMRSNLIQQLQGQLRENPDGPAYWAADVRRIVEVNGKALMAEDHGRLSGAPSGLSDGDYLRWIREHLLHLCDALAGWPALHEAARETDPLPG